jgi:1,4-dihydroxy-2-naphthoate octaprenyltransferase
MPEQELGGAAILSVGYQTRDGVVNAAARWMRAAGPPLVLVLALQGACGVAIAHHAARLSVLTAALTIVYFVPDGVGRRLVNDYQDYRNGLDGPGNVRPDSALALGLDMRMVGQAGVVAAGVAAAIAIWVALITEPWLLLLGPVFLAVYFLYAGGPRPLGYIALGELMDFIVTGTAPTLLVVFVNARSVSVASVVACVGVGLLFMALMLHNNARDIGKDALAGKRTLPQVISQGTVKALYTACLSGYYLTVLGFGLAARLPWALLPLITLPWTVRLAMRVMRHDLGEQMVSWKWLYYLLVANLCLFVVGCFA